VGGLLYKRAGRNVSGIDQVQEEIALGGEGKREEKVPSRVGMAWGKKETPY